jgi:uridine monophosphate synthetase
MMVSSLSYTERAAYCRSSIAKQLLQLMDEKKSNLCVSADVTSAAHLLSLADQLGPFMCMLKTHIDILDDFTPLITQQLRMLAQQHHFLLFEDRKFADIGQTVKHQYAGGLYRIADWADLINAHSLPGPGVIQGLAAANQNKRGLLLIAEMSSAGHLMNANYIQQTLAMATAFPEFVMGFITQHALSADPQWIHITPGVKRDAEQDSLGQQYISPQKALLEQGSDVIIVGRGIIQASNAVAEAQYYREEGWECYQQRISRP